MKILIKKLVLAFGVLFELVELIAAVNYKSIPLPPLVPPKPAYTTRLRQDQFHVEKNTLISGDNYGRIYSYIPAHSQNEKVRFYQIEILDTHLLFGMEEENGRLVNAYLIHDNTRPHQISNCKTHVANANGIEFVVHKSTRGVIIGASPPPNRMQRPPWYAPRESTEQVVGHQQSVAGTDHQKAIAGTGHLQQVAGTGHKQPVAGTSHQQPAADTSHQQPAADTSHQQPQVGIGPHRPQVVRGPHQISIGPQQIYQVGIGPLRPPANDRT